jgi:lipid A 3-O-deacylase
MPMNIKQLLLATVVATFSFSALALDLRPGGAFVQGGLAEHHAYNVTAGVLWPWSWRRDFGRTQLTGLTEGFVSHWSARDETQQRQSFTQIGVVPMVRMRLDGGRSPWFLEGGIGLSVMDRKYRSGSREFSTAFNFVDVVGVGRNFGPDGRHELGLRLNHVSNAGIKKPNPGETFVQLRYAVRF